ncbi:MAG TPA: dihydroorotate dehydrogenase-like protein [Opitutus sp.]|nr:dihydroorotate dehydrogenase-like protein [Opitutus sp.]
MDLSTTYLGLPLSNPLVVGASPFCDHADVARKLQDAGAAAIVMRSLFEEQIDAEQRALVENVETAENSFSEASSFFPQVQEYQLTPDHYLRQLEHLKSQLSIPVIGSLNGRRPGGWIDYARRMESAGANAIELNLYQLVTDPTLSSEDVEATMLETVSSVVQSVRVPVAVKLSPFHTALPWFAQELDRAGAAGIVLFNRFYQPDFNLEDLEAQPTLRLSDSNELLLRLRWLAILSPHTRGSLIASGGIHSSEDVIKAILAGAHAVQTVSVLLKHGPRIVTTLLQDLRRWMSERDYRSVAEFRGAMNLSRCPDPAALERANYVRILQSWRI